MTNTLTFWDVLNLTSAMTCLGICKEYREIRDIIYKGEFNKYIESLSIDRKPHLTHYFK